MKGDRKRIILSLLALFFLMLALLPVMMLATGQREIDAFTSRDWLLFRVLLTVELGLAIVMLVLAVKLARLLRGGGDRSKAAPVPWRLEARRSRFTVYLTLLALLLSMGAMLWGVSAGKGREEALGNVLLPWIVLGIVLPLVLTLASWLLSRHEAKRSPDLEPAGDRLPLLARLRFSAGGFALFLAAIGLWDAFSLGLTGSGSATTLLPCVLYVAAGLYRVRVPTPDEPDSAEGDDVSKRARTRPAAVDLRAEKELRYFRWLSSGKYRGPLPLILDLPFSWFDRCYARELALFRAQEIPEDDGPENR